MSGNVVAWLVWGNEVLAFVAITYFGYRALRRA